MDNGIYLRRRIRVTGTVQGVGFRPWVYRLATARRLAGGVLNDSRGVVIEVEGPADRVESFVAAIRSGRVPPTDSHACDSPIKKPLPLEGEVSPSGGGEIKRPLSLEGEVPPSGGGEIKRPLSLEGEVPPSGGGEGEARTEASGPPSPSPGLRPPSPSRERDSITLTRPSGPPSPSRERGYLADGAEAPPPLARIVSVEVETIPPTGQSEFTIRSSEAAGTAATQVAPDMAVCGDCLKELFDPADRRFRYPFINCTHCGPRYSIILDVPYDRPRTTMSTFRMCPECRREYDDPANRRFHAQPNACPVCGPRLSLHDAQGRAMAPAGRGDAVEFVRGRLLAGDIVAMKGLTGYHLACDARNETVVAGLRRRKRRDEKPLALMVADAAQAATLVHLDGPSRRLLESPERPIVLVPRREDAAVATSVAPRSRYLGLILPYAPLHWLLMAGGFPPLVMTSANLSEEPMCRANEEVFQRLSGIADLYLLNDRPIQTICDDSVTTIQRGEPLVIRRARGYAPRPIPLPGPEPREPILAVGPELKNCVCITRGGEAYVSQHIGDLKNALAVSYFEETVDKLRRLLEVAPAVVAHDLHPAYRSTRYALALEGVRLTAVQHHHAHVASVCAEHALAEPVIGLAMDGTGYGTDGRTWGSEFLEVRPDGTFSRLGHLSYMAMPGGDAAVEQVSRIAWGCLLAAFGDQAEALADRWLPDTTEEQRLIWKQMIGRRLNAPLACGLGRLFDAASALAGVSTRSSYEGQAAVELEAAAESGVDQGLAYEVVGTAPGMAGTAEAGFEITTAPLIRDLVAAREAGQSAGRVAARFHNAVISFLLDGAQRARRMTGLDRVALAGGCFLNSYLVERLVPELERRGLRVYRHREVSPGDGGVALGQAEVARQRMAAGTL